MSETNTTADLHIRASLRAQIALYEGWLAKYPGAPERERWRRTLANLERRLKKSLRRAYSM